MVPNHKAIHKCYSVTNKNRDDGSNRGSRQTMFSFLIIFYLFPISYFLFSIFYFLCSLFSLFSPVVD